MNALTRAQNVWKRVKNGDGKAGLIVEIARALESAYQQGIREGAVAMVDRASNMDLNLSQKERASALVEHYYFVTGLKKP